MKEHIKFVHDGKIHKCPLCDEFFSRKDNLNKHAKIVHDGKVLNCPLCNEFFSYKDNLQKHVKLVHDGKKLKCPLCDELFSCKDNLNKHVKAVHEGKKLKCSICDWKYWELGSKSALKRHMEKHQSEKNYTVSANEDKKSDSTEIKELEETKENINPKKRSHSKSDNDNSKKDPDLNALNEIVKDKVSNDIKKDHENIVEIEKSEEKNFKQKDKDLDEKSIAITKSITKPTSPTIPRPKRKSIARK